MFRACKSSIITENKYEVSSPFHLHKKNSVTTERNTTFMKIEKAQSNVMLMISVPVTIEDRPTKVKHNYLSIFTYYLLFTNFYYL